MVLGSQRQVVPKHVKEALQLMANPVSAGKAAVLLVVSLVIILGGIIFVKAPSTIVLITAGGAVMTLSVFWGVKWDDIQDDILQSLKAMFIPILILLAVGMLVGAWIISGTVPLMVYYGLKILSPSSFLLVAALVCSLMSVMTGTSWGTMSTVGIALMGVSAGLGVPLYYTAGAIVVGAIFGDKLSPLSDSTILASGVSNVELREHCKYLLWTTVPGYLISLLLYAVLGFQFRQGTVEGQSLQLILSTLEKTFNLNPILFLPPVVVLVLIIMKKPTLPVFGVGIMLGVVLAIVFQGASLKAIAIALNTGYATATKVAIVDKMLMRGGLSSMLGSTALLIGAAFFGAPLRTAGVIQVLVDWIQKVAKTPKSILFSGFTVHCLAFMVVGSYYVTYAVLAPMITPLYDKFGLHRKNFSRSIEDTGTAFAPVIPWSVTGAFTISTLGIDYSHYILYAPMTYLGLVFALFYIFTGIGIAKADPEPLAKGAAV